MEIALSRFKYEVNIVQCIIQCRVLDYIGLFIYPVFYYIESHLLRSQFL